MKSHVMAVAALVAACLLATVPAGTAFADEADGQDARAVIVEQSAPSAIFTSDGITYGVLDETAHTVCVGDGVNGDTAVDASSQVVVAIPQTVSHEGTDYTVTSIAAYAFSSTKITGVSIPATVEKIGDYAFYDACQLASCTFAEGSKLKSMGSYCFALMNGDRGKDSLTAIALPDSLVAVPQYAFFNRAKLADVSLGAALPGGIGQYAFAYCSSIEELTIPPMIASSWNDPACGSCVFFGCSSLKALYVYGDATYYIDYLASGRTFTTGCTSLKKVVYYGKMNWEEYTPDVYYNAYGTVRFYASKEDAESGTAQPVGTAQVRAGTKFLDTDNTIDWSDGVKYGNITAGLSGDDIAGGAIPELASDQTWKFMTYYRYYDKYMEKTYSDSFSNDTYAYPIDNNDLANGKLNVANSYFMNSPKYQITGTTITLASGKTIAQGVEYTLTYKDSKGNELSAITEPGFYTVFAVAKDSAYHGSISTGVSVVLNSSWTRLAGADRYETMRKVVSAAITSGQSDYVVIATGDNWPDALAASALAGVKNSAIFLVDGKASRNAQGRYLSTDQRQAIAGTGATHAIIVGGTGVVSDAIKDEIAGIGNGITVSRFAGENRSQTAYSVYKKIASSSIAGDKWGRTAIVTTGNNFADALSISAFAYTQKAPIFLATNGALDSDSYAALTSGSFDTILVIGGTNAVPTLVENNLRGAGKAVKRLSGADRYATSLEVAKYEVSCGLGFNGVVVASGDNNHWADALPGSALCGKGKAVMLLAASDGSNADALKGYLSKYKYSVQNGYVLGGTAAVPDSTVNALEDVWK